MITPFSFKARDVITNGSARKVRSSTKSKRIRLRSTFTKDTTGSDAGVAVSTACSQCPERAVRATLAIDSEALSIAPGESRATRTERIPRQFRSNLARPNENAAS